MLLGYFRHQYTCRCLFFIRVKTVFTVDISESVHNHTYIYICICIYTYMCVYIYICIYIDGSIDVDLCSLQMVYLNPKMKSIIDTISLSLQLLSCLSLLL